MDEGDDRKTAAKKVGRCPATSYNWLKQWNQNEVQGLKPQFDGGPKPKLPQQQKQKQKQKQKGQTWTTKHVQKLIKEQYNVEYSQRHIRTILKNLKLGLNYSKPRPKDYRKPENAEQELKKKLKPVLKNKNPKETVIGYLDEVRPQTTDNNQRLWSPNKPTIQKNTTKYKANTFRILHS